MILKEQQGYLFLHHVSDFSCSVDNKVHFSEREYPLHSFLLP